LEGFRKITSRVEGGTEKKRNAGERDGNTEDKVCQGLLKEELDKVVVIETRYRDGTRDYKNG
jgi:hypothetical protein